MTSVEQVYALQQETYREIDDLNWQAYDAKPDVRARKEEEARQKIERLNKNLAKAQAEVGGKVFLVPNENLGDLEKKVKRFKKKAEKNEAPAPHFEVTDIVDSQIVNENGQKYLRESTYVIAAGDPPRKDGWTFLATLEHLEDANVIRSAPGVEIDLSVYREVGPKCEHCNKVRSRKDTYIVQHEDGTIKQVGRTCLSDFITTLTPERVVDYFTFLHVLEEADEREWSFGSGEKVWDTYDFLAHVALKIRENGWASRSKAWEYGAISTADSALNNLDNKIYQRRSPQGSPLWTDPTEEDEKKALAAIAWLKDLEPESDFDHNLKLIGLTETLTRRHVGIAAYVIQAHKKAIEKQVKEKREEERRSSAANAHIGSKKERVVLTLTVTNIHEYPGTYQTVFITTLEDEEGHTFKWFGSYGLDIGETYEGKWTIKDHEVYKGLLQTVINRPASLNKVEVTEKETQK